MNVLRVLYAIVLLVFAQIDSNTTIDVFSAFLRRNGTTEESTLLFRRNGGNHGVDFPEGEHLTIQNGSNSCDIFLRNDVVISSATMQVPIFIKKVPYSVDRYYRDRIYPLLSHCS